MKVGDIVRYATGPTALMKITHVSRKHDGVTDRFFGWQCLGGLIGAYADECSPINPNDQREWNNHERWRIHEPPVGKKIVDALEKPKCQSTSSSSTPPPKTVSSSRKSRTATRGT